MAPPPIGDRLDLKIHDSILIPVPVDKMAPPLCVAGFLPSGITKLLSNKELATCTLSLPTASAPPPDVIPPSHDLSP